ncbi:Variant surface glycoprotein [Trypanosoma congolense IL3000]|uniref:Variant surface glycoprotein n=1 Tax=Trypanosoma congolense (strain IL3000) TaxID=1068625 RepID=F9W6R7_TRYCI|nr:Variant surface glycoprotein [Trypanosoma congolense IL3000]
MWKTMKVIVMILVMVLSTGLLEVGGYNDDIYNKLCTITKTASGLLKLEAGNEVLRGAIYGGGDSAKFGEGGKVTEGGRCVGLSLRTQLCTYFNRGNVWEGCYAESVLGALFCICAPGGRGGDVVDLCGAVVAEYNEAGWWGSWHSTGTREDLFKKVWGKAIKKCLEENENIQDVSEELKKLEDAMSSVREKIKGSRRSSDNLYFLGGSGTDRCDGDGKNVCAAYQAGPNRSASIPWMKKIEEAMEEMKIALARQVKEAKDVVIAPPAKGTEESSAAHRAAAESEHPTVLTKSTPHKNNLQNSDEEPGTEIALSSGNSEAPAKLKTKINHTASSVTDLSHLATNPDEDGSLLTKPLWLFLAARLI